MDSLWVSEIPLTKQKHLVESAPCCFPLGVDLQRAREAAFVLGTRDFDDTKLFEVRGGVLRVQQDKAAGL